MAELRPPPPPLTAATEVGAIARHWELSHVTRQGGRTATRQAPSLPLTALPLGMSRQQGPAGNSSAACAGGGLTPAGEPRR